MKQQITFAPSRRNSHRYATVGEDPPIVKGANWLSHLEVDCQSRN